MPLNHKDLELIERLIYKNADDIAVSIARSFERLEERINVSESRIHTRLSDIDDKMEGIRQEASDELGEVKVEIREIARTHELEGVR